MKNALLLCGLIAAGPALAQTTPAAPAASATASQIKVGATVRDASGAEVGTVDQVNGDVVVVNTGTNKVGLPMTSVAVQASGPVIGATKAQLNEAAAQSAAQAKAQLQSLLVAGTPVRGTAGAVLGTVKAADPAFVTLTTDKGEVRLPISGFAARPEGLVVGTTAAELEAAVAASKPR